ncbi:hypothetical protein NC652_015496 [Populus alba x Populus x berolinensis]|nr:hypothetical protein NC652_015496 [Populus alba x Populus x berolinensis]
MIWRGSGALVLQISAKQRSIPISRIADLQFKRGELGWGRKRRSSGGGGRQSGDTFTFVGESLELILSVTLLAFLTVNQSCYYTEISV